MPKSFAVNWKDGAWTERFDFKGHKAYRKYLNEGKDGTPELFMIKWEPGVVLGAHSHDKWELIFVVEGEMWVGEKRCPAGTFVYNNKDVTYGPLRAGPEGVVYFNLRPTKADLESKGGEQVNLKKV